MAASGRSKRVAASGRKWPLQASGRKWSQVVASGRPRQFPASGRKWPLPASGRKWPQVAAFGDFKNHIQSNLSEYLCKRPVLGMVYQWVVTNIPRRPRDMSLKKTEAPKLVTSIVQTTGWNVCFRWLDERERCTSYTVFSGRLASKNQT